MKSSLAIVVCIGLYLCAVSAPKPPKISKYISEAYKTFRKSQTGNGNIETPRFISLGPQDPECKMFRESGESLKVDKGFEEVQLNYLRIIEMSYFYDIVIDSGRRESTWFIFKFADLDFKINCIKAFEGICKSVSCLAKLRDKKRNYAPSERVKNQAFRAVLQGIRTFIADLMNSGINTDAKNELELYTKNEENPNYEEEIIPYSYPTKTFFEIFKFWFSPDCDENDLKNEITKMKNDYKLNNDKAAKVMVLLKKFYKGKMNNKYLPATENSIWPEKFLQFTNKNSE